MAAPTTGSSTSRRSREPGPGEVDIGSFRRMEEIGRGSFATVYKAMHMVRTSQTTYSGPAQLFPSSSMVLLARISELTMQSAWKLINLKHWKRGGYVAIKSVNLSKLNKKLKDNLFSEISILKDLHHPHIVSLIDCRESTSHIHLVMEYCQLGDLSMFIKKRDTLGQKPHTKDMICKYPNPSAGGLNEVVVRHFLQQLASALEFLRNRNLIHRDVKPQNLLLNPSPLFYSKNRPEVMPYTPSENSLVPVAGIESLPMLKIADFGFARSLPSTSLAETLCGSPLYMAPEILRYEKYDAKADLWSVGTVLYEMMVGRPPFRASNHVELLRKIERGEDRIKFPEETVVSDSMKKLIRALLRRNPVERLTFNDFFDNTVVKDTIPGLVLEDRPRESAREDAVQQTEKRSLKQAIKSTETRKSGLSETAKHGGSHDDAPNRVDTDFDKHNPPRTETMRAPRSLGTPPRSDPNQRQPKRHNIDTDEVFHDAPEQASRPRRPSIVSYATAPARQELANASARRPPAAVMQRQSSRNSPSPTPLAPRETQQDRERALHRKEDRTASREAREAQERAAQDVAFERDYVVVEKRAVEVNAFADELAASPRIQGNVQTRQEHPGMVVRRATTQNDPTTLNAALVTQARASQAAAAKRPDYLHHRTTSYERRARGASASSAISKAINLASGRLWSMGLSPPLGLGLGRGGPSPPLYAPFPAYPTNQGSMIMVGDTSKVPLPVDEDFKAVHVIEESATRSDVVYGFAEVKYKQLIPLAPSMHHGLGLRQAGTTENMDGANPEDDGLTVDAVVALSEEALVLYVKALSLLAKSMDIAGAWWARKGRGTIAEESTSAKLLAHTSGNAAAGNRVNNVVQWVRSRFNEVLEKAEFVRLKLIDAQKRLPRDHPSHPNNHPSASCSAAGLRGSAENVIISPNVTAEKLMFERAVEMSRSAAVNELVTTDLPGCEIAYVTAIRMLEAILDNEDEPAQKRFEVPEKDQQATPGESETLNVVDSDDRESVLKSEIIVTSSISMKLNSLTST